MPLIYVTLFVICDKQQLKDIVIHLVKQQNRINIIPEFELCLPYMNHIKILEKI